MWRGLRLSDGCDYRSTRQSVGEPLDRRKFSARAAFLPGMRVRLLLAALVIALLAVPAVILDPFGGESASERLAEQQREACGDGDAGEEAREEAAREEAEREAGHEKDAAEIARERAFGGCTESENEILKLTTPNEVMLARQLIGADPGIDPARYFRAAQAQAAAVGERTATVAPDVAGLQWTLDRPTTKRRARARRGRRPQRRRHDLHGGGHRRRVEEHRQGPDVQPRRGPTTRPSRSAPSPSLPTAPSTPGPARPARAAARAPTAATASTAPATTARPGSGSA